MDSFYKEEAQTSTVKSVSRGKFTTYNGYIILNNQNITLVDNFGFENEMKCIKSSGIIINELNYPKYFEIICNNIRNFLNKYSDFLFENEEYEKFFDKICKNFNKKSKL